MYPGAFCKCAVPMTDILPQSPCRLESVSGQSYDAPVTCTRSCARTRWWRVIQVIYQWDVPEEKQAAFLAAWERTTLAIRESATGARGSFCVVSVDSPTEILTVAKWEELGQWQEFVKAAKLTSMKEMHELGTQISSRAYEQKGDFTV